MLVFIFVTFVSPAKFADMPFEELTLVDPYRNYVLDEVQFTKGNGKFRGLSTPLKSIGSLCCDARKKD